MRELDPTKCKKIVTHYDGSIGGTRYQCSRNNRKDGYCKQHHPDSQKARDEESKKKYNLDWHNKDYARLNRLQQAIMKLLPLKDKMVRKDIEQLDNALAAALRDSERKTEL